MHIEALNEAGYDAEDAMKFISDTDKRVISEAGDAPYLQIANHN